MQVMQPGQKYILFYKYPNTFKKLQAHVQYVLNVRWEKVFVDVKDYDVTSPFLLLRACSWPFFMLSLGRSCKRPEFFLLSAMTFSMSLWPGHLSRAKKTANLFLISSSSGSVHFFLVLKHFLFLTDLFSETIIHIH